MSSVSWQARLTLLGWAVLLVAVSLVGRLYQKAVLDHAASVKVATHQYGYRQEQAGQRGTIAVEGGPAGLLSLAENERRFQVLAVPLNIDEPKKTAVALAPKLGIEPAVLLEAINNKKPYVPPLKHRLTRSEADAIAALDLPGVLILPEMVRTYPEQTLASQLLGFVNADGVGNYGVEGTYDSILKGQAGYQVGEKDNQGRFISISDAVPAQDGKTIVLTIDRDIQHFAEKLLADAVEKFQADSGSITVVEPKTGAVVAMAAMPTFNPNEFNKTDTPAKFLNPVIAAVWEPGSIAKPFVMAQAIEKGKVEPDTKGTFGSSVIVGNHEIFTAEKKAFGEETMTQVLENSDNVAMVWVSEKLGAGDERDGLSRFGMGETPNPGLSGAVSGHLPLLKMIGDIARANMAFGQGFSATPLQIIMAYAALFNDGVLMRPYIVKEVRDASGLLTQTAPRPVRPVVSSETARKMTLMLESVVDHGHAKRAGVAGYRVGGKTGTAQVANPAGGYFDDRHVGALASCFPVSEPRYCSLVKLDQPKTVKFAESSAAPVDGELNRFMAINKQIPPDRPGD